MRSRLAPPSRRPANYPSTAPGGGRATRKRGDPTLERRTHLGAYRGFAVGGRRVSRVRGAGANIGRGEARVSGLGLAGDCVSSVAEPRSPRFFLITCFWIASLAGSVARCREERGFRLTEKIIGHVQYVIKPTAVVVRQISDLPPVPTPPLFRSSRARVSRPSLPLAPDTPPRPARAPPLRRRDTGEGNAAGD